MPIARPKDSVAWIDKFECELDRLMDTRRGETSISGPVIPLRSVLLIKCHLREDDDNSPFICSPPPRHLSQHRACFAPLLSAGAHWRHFNSVFHALDGGDRVCGRGEAES